MLHPQHSRILSRYNAAGVHICTTTVEHYHHINKFMLQLQEKLQEKVEAQYREQIDMNAEIDMFHRSINAISSI